MIHIKVFETNAEYNIYTFNNTRLKSGILYYIKEDDTAHMFTNNIDGTNRIYNFSKNEADIPKEDLTDEDFAFSVDSASANQTGSFVGPSFVNTYELPVTYESSNPNVATVDEYGTVTVLANGSTTISVIFAGDEHYNSKTISYTLTVKIPTNLSDNEFGFTSSSANATQEGSFNGPTLRNTHNLTVTYQSSNTNVATINANGNITIIADGVTTISARFNGNEDYNAKLVTYVLNVDIPDELTEAEFSWPIGIMTLHNDSETVELTNTHNLPVTYVVSDENVIMYDGDPTSAMYTVLWPASDGTATLSAVFAGNSQYKPKTAILAVTVDVQYDVEDNDFRWSGLSAKATQAGSFNGPDLINNNNFAVAYQSSDTSVATISANGSVTVIANGTTTISAIFAGNDYYNAKTATYTLLVQIPQDLPANTFKWTYNEASVTEAGIYTGNPFINTLGVSPVVFSSSNESVATVDQNGIVTVIANGFTYIRAEFAGNEQYNRMGRAYPLSVAIPQELTNQEFSWSSNSASITNGQSFELPTMTNTHNLPVTYESSNTDVATVDSNGTIHIVGNGSATISAVFVGNADYAPKSISYTLTIAIPQELDDSELSWYPETDTNISSVNDQTPVIMNEHNLPLTFSSSNTEAATVDNNGNITIVGNGNATITAVFAGNAQYKAKTVTVNLIIQMQQQLGEYDLYWSSNHLDIVDNSSVDYPTLYNTQNLPLTFTSSDTNVATVDANGQVTVVGNGSTTISAIFAGNTNWYAKTITYTITVAIPGELSNLQFAWSGNSATITEEGSSFETPSLINTLGLEVTYSSSDTNIATIDGTGKISVVGNNGSTTISAIFAGNSEYKAKTVTYTFTVAIPQDVPAGALAWSNGGADVNVYPENGGVVTTPTLTNTLNLPVTYQSYNTNVATIDSNGQVTVVGDGNTSISAIFAGNSQYNSYEVSYRLIADTSAHIITSTSNAPVMTVMKNNNFAANNDFMTENEAKAVTDIGTIFKNNKNITSFDEFQYFTRVTQLGTEAFAGCTNLSTLGIPKNVSYISVWAFGATNISSFTVDPLNNSFSSEDGIIFNKNKTKIVKFPSAKTGTYVIPNTVTSLEQVSFGDSKLDTLTINANISSIPSYCLWGSYCTIIEERQTPPSIDSYACNNRTSQTLYVPAGCKAAYKAANIWKDFKYIYEPIRNLTDAELGWDNSSFEITEASSVEWPTLDNTFDLPVTYSSSDTSVATIDQSGTITVVSNGTTTITASFAGNVEYYAKNTTYTLTVAILEEVPSNTFYWSDATASATQSGAFNGPILTNTNNLPVTYTTSSSIVATINSSGQVTILSNGTTTISAVFEGNSQYNAKTVSYELTVRIQQNLPNNAFGWSSNSATITSASSVNLPSLVNENNLPVTYQSSDTSIVDIDSEGKLTLYENGTITISAIFAGNDDWKPKTVTYSLTVQMPADLTEAEFGWSASTATANAAGVLANPTLTNVYNLPVTFTSSNREVATVDANGQVTAIANGQASITAIFAGNSDYKFRSSTYVLTVRIPATMTDSEFGWSASTAYANSTGTLSNGPTLNNTHNLPVTYQSTNEFAATVNSGGVVTVVGNGTANIRAIFAGNANYAAKTVSYSLSVVLKQNVSDSDFYWNPATVVISSSGDTTRPVLVNNLNLPVRYTSSQTNVATIDEYGNITIVGNGTTNIQAIFDGNSQYNAKTRTAMFVVNIEEVPENNVLTSTDNPAVMQVMYNAGLAANADYMTQSEAEAVTNQQLAGLFANNSDITTFDEFQYFTGITSLDTKEIPDPNVTYINIGVFEGSSLQSITLPPSLETIGAQAFKDCQNLSTVQFVKDENDSNQNNITSIGDQAFANCTSLTDISSLIEVYTDYDETTGETIPVKTLTFENGGNQFYNSGVTGSVDLTYVENLGWGNTFDSCPAIDSITLPTNTLCTEIPDGFLNGMRDIRNIDIPDNITRIGNDALKGVEFSGEYGDPSFDQSQDVAQVEMINIYTGVTEIGSGNFQYMPNLSQVYINSNNVETIDASTFGEYCNNTFTIYVALGSYDYIVQEIESHQPNFDTTRITTDSATPAYPANAIINITDHPALMNAINNSSSIQHADTTYFTSAEAAAVTNAQFAGVFSNNNAITNFDQLQYFTGLTMLPSKQLANGTTVGAFQNCSNLQSISLPPNITNIGQNAFYNTTNLTNIDTTNINMSNITSIGDYAFHGSGYTDVVEFISNLTGVGSLGTQVFAGIIGTQNDTEIIIPNGVQGIGNSAFADYGVNPWITRVDIGTGMVQIGTNAFAGQSALQKVVVRATTPPQIAGNTFADTNSTFRIYVPLQSINTYKTNSIKGWATYADRIYSIQNDLDD